MTVRPFDQAVSEEDIAALARLSGLTIARDRIALLRSEVVVAMEADRDLGPAVSRSTVPGGEPFDPAWSSVERANRP
jgi:hypothetical protein